MALLDLWFESGQDSLSVRHFSVNEALSRPFEVGVMAASRVDDIDFESIIGRKASFKIAASGVSAARTWQGICNHFEQVQSEPNGLSTYFLRIVPELWLLTQKQDYRVFQHLSIPDIAKKILEPWGIQPVVNVDATAHQPQEYRVQYGETDYAFLTRLLEDAGISFLLSQGDKGPQLTLTDKPQSAEARAGGAIPYADNPNPEGGKAFLTKVSVSREMKPGAFTIRDHDFRRRAGYALLGKAPEASGVEAKLEQYQYRPGSFIVDGQGGQEASASEKEGQALASRGLEAARANRESMSFETNLTDLAPGSVFSMSGHSRSSTSGSLLATELNLQGTPGQQWTITGKAAPTSATHRPARATPRPKIAGVQSAVVVGPQGEEIHTDEHGRIKVQFHWDRQGQMDDKSSCWVRVSQGWAGGGFGMIALPRVGQEVTVGFFEGDPDQPVVIGRVFNTENRVPYKLPDNKTRTTWRSESTPSTGGSAGYNEIMFEDRKDAELISIHAEKDLQKVVKASEMERTGADRTVTVGRNRTANVTGIDATLVGQTHTVAIAEGGGAGSTSLTMSDKHIVATTGEATVTFDGANLSFEAKGNITLVAKDGDVSIKGGPHVKINSV